MLRRLFEWIVGRKEPAPDLDEKERRLQMLELAVRVQTRRHR